MEDSDFTDLKEKVDLIDRRTRSIVAGACALIGLVAVGGVAVSAYLWGPGLAAALGGALLFGACAGRLARKRAVKQLAETAGQRPRTEADDAKTGEGRGRE